MTGLLVALLVAPLAGAVLGMLAAVDELVRRLS